MKQHCRDVIITGLPRSGTTLATTLAHNPPHSIALHELVNKDRHSDDVRDVAVRIGAEYDEIRAKLLAGEAIAFRESLDGAPLTNYVTKEAGHRKKNYKCTQRTFRDLSPKFALSMKNPALYTAILGEIIALNRFTIIALVRNPIDLILSWRTVPFPIAEGRLPGGERYWPALAKVGLSERPVLEKQVLIWELFAHRFVAAGNALSILKYEDLCENPGLMAKLIGIPFRDVPISPVAHQPNAIPDNLPELIRSLAPTATELYPTLFS